MHIDCCGRRGLLSPVTVACVFVTQKLIFDTRQAGFRDPLPFFAAWRGFLRIPRQGWRRGFCRHPLGLGLYGVCYARQRRRQKIAVAQFATSLFLGVRVPRGRTLSLRLACPPFLMGAAFLAPKAASARMWMRGEVVSKPQALSPGLFPG